MVTATHNNPSASSRFPLIGMFLGLFLTMTLVGCGGSGATIIKGRVIAGPVGQSVAASPEDERFLEPGIPGIDVAVLSKNGSAARGRGVFAKATSDQWGNFELRFPGGQYPRDAIQVRVHGDGIFTSKSTSFLPPDGDQMLCVVITRPGYIIPEPPEEE
ncbi:MAG: hypothetical protein ACWA5W_06610 [Phycisphaerales bacterium]